MTSSEQVETKRCEWYEQEDDWAQSGCGQAFEFNDDGAVENGFKFCPFCGGVLTVRRDDEEN